MASMSLFSPAGTSIRIQALRHAACLGAFWEYKHFSSDIKEMPLIGMR